MNFRRLAALLCGGALFLSPLAPIRAANLASLDQAGRPCEHVYVVVWRMDFGGDGQLSRLTKDRVIDPDYGRTPEEAASRPIQLELPAEYVRAAEAFLRQRPHRPGGPNPAYTFTFYDPVQPARANMMTRSECMGPPTT